jgi:hypothetical protein
MGLRDEITAGLAEAFSDPDGLLDAVTEFVGVRETGQGTFDPVTEKWTPGTLTYTGRGVFGGYEAEMVDGTKILATDTKLLALQAEVTAVPAVDDTINGAKVIAAGQDPTGATWTLQLRRV